MWRRPVLLCTEQEARRVSRTHTLGHHPLGFTLLSHSFLSLPPPSSCLRSLTSLLPVLILVLSFLSRFFSFLRRSFPSSCLHFFLPPKRTSSRASPSIRLLLLPPLTPPSRLSFLVLLVSSPAFLSPLFRFFSLTLLPLAVPMFPSWYELQDPLSYYLLLSILGIASLFSDIFAVIASVYFPFLLRLLFGPPTYPLSSSTRVPSSPLATTSQVSFFSLFPFSPRSSCLSSNVPFLPCPQVIAPLVFPPFLKLLAILSFLSCRSSHVLSSICLQVKYG